MYTTFRFISAPLFAGEMATSRLLATAKQEAAQRAAAKDERKKQLRAKLQSLQSLQSGTMAHEGEVKGAAAVPGGLMVNGVFIPRVRSKTNIVVTDQNMPTLLCLCPGKPFF